MAGAVKKQDPFQLFKVSDQPCDVLTIKVIEGKNITKGKFKDFFDVPDPYVYFTATGQIDAIKRTKTINNDMNPKWNEDIIYYLKPKSKPEGNKATPVEMIVYDDNYGPDGQIGEKITFDLNEIEYNKPIKKTFKFGVSEVVMEFKREVCKKQNVRLSLALCDEEKSFRAARKQVIFKTLQKLLGTADGPKTLKETPTIAVMGSGGGYRAMIAFYGVLKALEEMEILDTAMYTNGLSGSTWCQSTLYTNPKFPREGIQPAANVLKDNIKLNPLWILRPVNLMQMMKGLMDKYKTSAQPVTLTDLFGYFVGEHLLGKKMMNTTRLSHIEKKIRDGKAPMPIMACLHVRNDVSAMVYHDWIEFTPYEIGMSKYGTFVATKNFNDKFFMGTMTKSYEEAPLHFLMGVWGSAFSILLNRVLKKKKKKTTDPSQEGKSIREAAADSFKKKKAVENKGKDSDGEDDDTKEDKERKAAKEAASLPAWGDAVNTLVGKEIKDDEKPATTNKDEKTRSEELYGKGGLFGDGAMSSMFTGLYKKLFESRSFTAGKILNFMRGFSWTNAYPFNPFAIQQKTITQANEFEKLGEAISAEAKKVFVVDAGLTFNSPYPTILRPQRKVDVILSFDFSARASDETQPFQELLLAEKWARIHKVPFPKIDTSVFKKEGMKECYVFQDENDDKVPIVMHFTLANVNFRKFSAPGVARAADDKKGDFNIFYKGSPYSTFNLQYNAEQFDNLFELMRFNTLLNKDNIIAQLKKSVATIRKNPHRWNVSKSDVSKSNLVNTEDKKKVEAGTVDTNDTYE